MNTKQQQDNAVPYEGRLYKPYDLDTGYRKCQVILTVQEYQNNGSLAVEALEVEDNEVVDTFDILTRNLNHTLQNDKYAFVDTNNCPFAPDFLRQNGIAKATGVYGQSGFCSYPLYEWDTTKFYADTK